MTHTHTLTLTHTLTHTLTLTLTHTHTQPSNLMIQITRSIDVLKLIDFGASRHYGVESITGQLEPSVDYQYMAPEVFRQEPVVPATDVWGVGVIIYIM